MSTPYDRLNSVRRRVENLTSSKTGKQLLRSASLSSSSAAAFAGIPLPPLLASTTEKDDTDPGLASVIKAAAYDNQTTNDPEASSSRLLGFTNAEKAARQMNQYFDYNTYSQQAPDDPARTSKVKLSKKQIQTLKKKKAEKKQQKRLEWLYND